RQHLRRRSRYLGARVPGRDKRALSEVAMATLRRALTFMVLLAVTASAQPRITTPKDEFGFNFGDDYQLATYQQLASYWHKLDRESDRMVVQEIGKTSEGRPHLMAIVTSPANHKNLARYPEISRQP